MKRTILLLSAVLALIANRAIAQTDWLDALLPANHILEKLPLADEAGKPLPAGLFTFEDFNNDGRKDLLLAHREAVAADKLDQPHPQVLAVCFFDPARKGYTQVLADEGGPLKWVRVLADPKTQRKFLVMEREDWQAETSVRIYSLGGPGKLEKVLETQSPWSHANVVVREGRIEVLYSSRNKPAIASQAESVFSWKETTRQFVDASGVPFSRVALLKEPTPTLVVVTAKPTLTTVPTRVVVSAAKPKPAVPAKPAPSASEAPVVPAAVAPSKGSSTGTWWAQPFSAPEAYAQLIGDLIPRRVKGNQLTPLGQEAKAFFDQLFQAGIKGTEYSDYRAGYLTAVASELYGLGDKTRGDYYLGLVLKYRPDFQKALDLKAKTVAPATP